MEPEELRRAIPALDRTTYLNTGASGPSPRRVVEAMIDCLERQAYEAPAAEGLYDAAAEVYDGARRTVADHVGAAPDEIALVNSTADGISRVAGALDWTPDDAVVYTALEHPAGVLPWQRLRQARGIETRVVGHENGLIDADEFADAVSGARLVCLSALDWCYGRRQPVADLVEIAHDAGAFVLVDAVQAVGQTDVDVGTWGADAVAASGHKWLLGPMGGGFLHVREDAAAALEPDHVGYYGVEEPDADEFRYRGGARRFEVGTTNPAPYAGLRAGVETIEAVGIDAVESRVATLTDRLKAGLPDDALRSPRAYESGLVTFTVDDPEATVERLADEGVRIRSLPRPGAVRASVHAFNDAGDVDRLLDAL